MADYDVEADLPGLLEVLRERGDLVSVRAAEAIEHYRAGVPSRRPEPDEDAELIDVAATHSRWLRHNGYVQPADCMDRLCELLVLVTGRLTGEPTAAPTRPTREQVGELIERIDRHCEPGHGWRRRSCPACGNLGTHADGCALESVRAALIGGDDA